MQSRLKFPNYTLDGFKYARLPDIGLKRLNREFILYPVVLSRFYNLPLLRSTIRGQLLESGVGYCLFKSSP